jgi:outer membrane protein assembly factor BamB
MMPMRHPFIPLACCILLTFSTLVAGPTEWSQFRGPGGAGVADGSTLPEHWTVTDPRTNVAWVAEIPGRGWSSPILWHGRVFVTSAVSSGAFKAPSKGIFGNDYAEELEKQGLSEAEIVKRVVGRDIEQTSETGEISYMVFALDANTGQIVWKQEAHRAKPFGGRHRKNTYASETPATDGERLYASFGGNVGVFCYTLEGTPLWTHTWPPQPIYLDFGTASSPIVYGGRVYQLHDNDGQSFLAALDAKTGKEIWNVKRIDLAARLASGWATPLVWESGSRTEIVTIGRGFVISYDTDGHELWRLKGMTQATPSPVVADNLLYVGSGSQGEANRPLYAVRPNAMGDISLRDDQKANDFVIWSQPRFSGYTPSPLVYRGRIYAVNDNGILQVADAKTGAEVYKARVGGGGFTFSSSPIASQGRIYLLSEDGDAFVLQAGDRYDETARNSFGEMSLATPAVDADSMYVRTQTKLYRIRHVSSAHRLPH